MKELLEDDAAMEASAMNIQEFLSKNNFSQDFFEHIMWPVISSSIGTIPLKDLKNYSISGFVELFATGVFSFFESPCLLHFPNGMSELIQKFTDDLKGKILLNTAVKKVKRNDCKIEIIDSNDKQITYEEVIFSTNFQINKKLIDNLTTAEKFIFEGIEYTNFKELAHSDVSFVPPNFFDRENIYIWENTIGSTSQAVLGPNLERPKDLLFTAKRSDEKLEIDENKVYRECNYLLEKLTVDSLLTKSNIKHIQGLNNSWYCGLSTIPGLLECCLVSGFVIGEKLGADYPFKHIDNANTVFENIKRLMINGHPSLYLFEKRPETI